MFGNRRREAWNYFRKKNKSEEILTPTHWRLISDRDAERPIRHALFSLKRDKTCFANIDVAKGGRIIFSALSGTLRDLRNHSSIGGEMAHSAEEREASGKARRGGKKEKKMEREREAGAFLVITQWMIRPPAGLHGVPGKSRVNLWNF